MNLPDQRLILLDCDGVLVNWNDGFHTWMTGLGYTRRNEHVYGIHERYGIDEDLAYRLVGEFNHSASIARLEPLPYAVAVVRELHFRHRFDFVVISSLSNDPVAAVHRRDNLYTHFGVEPWKEIRCIGCGDPKDRELARFKDTNFFWVEDKSENAELGLKFGLRPIILDAPYNQDTNPNIPRVFNWIQLWNHIVLR